MAFAQLQCQINRLAPYIPTASPVPDGLSDLVYEDIMVRSAYTIAVWANQQSVFIPLAKYQSWQNMLRFIADPSATALATYAPDLAGIFYLAAQIAGLDDACNLTLDVPGFWPPEPGSPAMMVSFPGFAMSHVQPKSKPISAGLTAHALFTAGCLLLVIGAILSIDKNRE